MMDGGPIDINEHRGESEARQSELRLRRIKRLSVSQAKKDQLQSDLEKLINKPPAKTQKDVFVKVQFLVRLLAVSSWGTDSRVQKLIQQTLDDMKNHSNT